MRPRQPRRHSAAAIVASLLALAAGQALVALPAAAAPHAPATATTVASAQDQVARSLARSLSDSTWRTRVQQAALAADEVPITALADRSGSGLTSELVRADRQIAAAKGLDTDIGSLLRLRLGDDGMRDALADGQAPWVAPAASDDNATTVVAYDSRGRAHALDARHTPDRPVYVVDIDSSKALAAGLGVLNRQLHHHGLASDAPASASASKTHADAAGKQGARAAAGGFWTTRIAAVELSDDEEPWVKGDAELYTLVTGFGQDGKVRVDPVDMPYLDNDGTVYRPGQILVNWGNYKYNLADAVMMEEDGSTNYRDLANAIATVLLTVTDQGTYIPLVNAILDAIPDDWWTDDPDYVDSWYTLARNDNGTRHGARGNGWMTVEPYFVEEF
ncbi:DUF3103 family protein [Streptomyces fructofermentans]|uniref:DUF3103 family protein n=1 Tax=Streptomyces fructofermentans TaxID=152141 RepID=UPI0037B9D91A